MNRTGWAAAVGSLYKTRCGRVVRISEYRVIVPDTRVIERITAESVPDEDGYGYQYNFSFDETGKCIEYYVLIPGTVPLANPIADFDLISAVQPAQVTKLLGCKNDLATRPQEGTVPATVVPRKDLP